MADHWRQGAKKGMAMGLLLAKACAAVGKAIALSVLVPLVAVTLWLPAGVIMWLPLPGRIRARGLWALRRGLWNLIAVVKFRGNKPVKIPVPGRMSWWRWILVFLFGKSLRGINRVSFNQIFPDIRISAIQVAGHEPADEWDWKMRAGTWVQVMLYGLFPPMQAGLPPIDTDPYEALRQAYTSRHRKLFDPPIMPLEFQESVDLGALAVRGPYAGYIRKYRRVGQDAGKN